MVKSVSASSNMPTRFNQYTNTSNNDYGDVLSAIRVANGTSHLDTGLINCSEHYTTGNSEELTLIADALIKGLPKYTQELKQNLSKAEDKQKHIRSYYYSTPKNAKTLFEKIKLEDKAELYELKTLLWNFIQLLDPTWALENEIYLEKKKKEIAVAVDEVTLPQQPAAASQHEPAKEEIVIADATHPKSPESVSEETIVKKEKKQNNSLLIVASQSQINNTNQKDQLLDDFAKNQSQDSNSNKLKNNAFEDNSYFARICLPEELSAKESPKSPTRTSCSLFTPTKTNIAVTGSSISLGLVGGALIAAGTGVGLPIAAGLLLLAGITAVGTGAGVVARSFCSNTP